MPENEAVMAAELASHLERFQEENPKLMRELDVLGVQIDEYEMVLAQSEPRVFTTTNTTTPI